MAVLIGTTSAGVDGANSNSAGIAFATRLQCILSGTVDSVWLKCGATVPTAANTGWAIYSDGAGVPNTRLTTSMSGTALTANTYSSVPVSPGLAVTSGTFYWIAFVGVGGVTTAYTNFAASGGDSSDDNTGLVTLPATWGETGGFTNIINMRAEGTAVSDATEARSDFEPVRFGPF